MIRNAPSVEKRQKWPKSKDRCDCPSLIGGSMRWNPSPMFWVTRTSSDDCISIFLVPYPKYQPSGEGDNCSLPATPHCLQRLQRRTACMPHHLQNPKWLMGSGKVSTPRVLGVLSNFRKISFLIWALLLWKKVTTEENGKK